jgi:hypothetical protein
MKYAVSLEIALPRERTVQLLADPELLPMWLRGLVAHEPLSGVHGRPGTKSRVVLRMGQQEFEATETGPETTLWESENEYRFSGLMMRLVGLLMPGSFRKQSLLHMQDFKAFAEHGQDVRDAKD